MHDDDDDDADDECHDDDDDDEGVERATRCTRHASSFRLQKHLTETENSENEGNFLKISLLPEDKSV
jgi:hypothetical protein